MRRFLQRVFGRKTRAGDDHAEQLEQLQQRCAALEHELTVQRDLIDAVLYSLGAQPGLHHERLRRDLRVALSRDRDAAPYTLLEMFELGVEAWRGEGLPRRVAEMAQARRQR